MERVARNTSEKPDAVVNIRNGLRENQRLEIKLRDIRPLRIACRHEDVQRLEPIQDQRLHILEPIDAHRIPRFGLEGLFSIRNREQFAFGLLARGDIAIGGYDRCQVVNACNKKFEGFRITASG